MVENFKKSLLAPQKDPDDNDDDENDRPKGVELKVTPTNVMFDPQFFDEIRKPEKNTAYLKVIEESTEEVKASMKAEDLKRSVRRYCDIAPKYFNLLGFKRNFVDGEHIKEYRDFMSKHVSL